MSIAKLFFASVIFVVTSILIWDYSSENYKTRIVGSSISAYPKTYTFEEAKLSCAKEGKVLPLTEYDFVMAEQRLNPRSEYWLANRQVANIEYTMATGKTYAAKEGSKYAFFCVSKNGKTSL